MPSPKGQVSTLVQKKKGGILESAKRSAEGRGGGHGSSTRQQLTTDSLERRAICFTKRRKVMRGEMREAL